MKLRLVALAALGLAPSVARAHGPEGHGEKPAAATDVRSPSAGGTGDLFEVLLKYLPVAPGQPTSFRVFVADAATNEPITGADVELTFAERTEVKVSPKPSGEPGTYLASVVFAAAGDIDTVASVSKGDDADLIALGSVHSGAPERAEPPHEDKSLAGDRRVPMVVGGAVVLALVALVAWRRRRRR